MKNLNSCALTRHLVGFNTINPPGNEHTVMERIGTLLEANGFAVSLYAMNEARSNLVATLAGNSDGLPLVFTGHIDTVPLGDVDWAFDPFRGEIDGDRLYGRGTTDMKGGIAAMIVAALRIATITQRKKGLVLIFTADEEVGCGGARHLVRQSHLNGKAGAIVVGEPTANYPLIGHKGIIWAQIESKGVSAHASMPEQGDNAISRMARIITRIDGEGLTPCVHPLLGQSTHNVGTIRAGSNPNLVPDQAVMQLDIRTVPGQPNQAVINTLRHLVGDEATVTPTVSLEPVISDGQDAWVQSCYDLLEPLLGKRPEPKAAPFMTDASLLKPVMGNPPTIILGPGEPTMAHKTNEYCSIEKLEQSVDVYFKIAQQWCSGSALSTGLRDVTANPGA